MILAGAHHLSNNADRIDALNVFPVPDGDTGTNMNLTITSGANEVKQSKNSSVELVANAFAKGLLMGARGNSGVILSQIFRGFSKGVEGKETLTSKEFEIRRSEEHTSELQSRGHLVCRLLLEQK